MKGMGPIKVLIVDDSLLSRELLAHLLRKDPLIEIAGMATNGLEAVELNKALRPDIITMDIIMPQMDGFQAIEQIMAYYPTPILVVTSAFPRNGIDMTFKALEIGALDLMEKPTHAYGPELSKKGQELVEKVKLLSKIKVIRHVRGRKGRQARKEPVPRSTERLSLLAIASSTGGPRTLQYIFNKLPENFPAGILVVQHMSEGFLKGMADWLSTESRFTVREAKDGDRAMSGTALVAPGGRHMIVGENGFIRLTDDPPFQGHKPSGTVLFESVAQNFGSRAVGLILTGMGSDGAQGMKSIREHGGRTMAQDEKTSIVYGMPKAAVDLGVVDQVLPLERIPDELRKLFS